ncbi:MAG: VWA domain-containing protein [Candidatus Aminicenantes bacterium]|nr:VWA domain-containing protein [Candidatus Aminicenantes bacterium]
MNRTLPFILKHFPPGPYRLCLCVFAHRQVVRRQVRVRALFLLFILLLLNTAVPARGETQLTLLKGEAVNEKEARLFFMVFDETGKPVKGLNKENFSLEIDGETVGNIRVDSVSATVGPLSIVLGIDVSGSMKGKPFTETRRSISRFLDQLDRKDYTALMSFGTEVVFLTGFTGKRYEIRETMEGLRPVEQWTHLYDATCAALTKAQKNAPTTRKAVILISDGKDEQSAKSRAEALEKAGNTGVPVFAIGFGHSIDREYLEEIGKVSGGYFLSTPDPEEIVTLYDRVLEMLESEYAVGFVFSKSPGKYMARLTLDHGGQTVDVYKEFLFNPTGAPLVIEKEVPEGSRIPWLKKVPIEIVILIVALIVIFAVILVWFRSRLTEERADRMTAGVSKEDAFECELEFIEDMEATKTGFIEDLANKEGKKVGDSTKFSAVPDISLQVDCYKGRIIPLLYRGADMLEELIIARASADRKEKEHMKKGGAYLLVSADKQVISRPKENRFGHARIFHSGGERYSVEDLGSKVGTFVNNEPIRGQGPVELQDGDLIEVGGRSGIRIVFNPTAWGSGEKQE